MSDSSGSSEGSFVEQLGKLGCQILQGLIVGLLKNKNKPILTSGSKTGSQTDSSDGLAATVLPS